MSKIFRKIRQNLFSKGKTGRYLTYAVGEIILVVIGILIALQINNWNENRKLAKLELSYYENLYQDLIEDSLEVDFKIYNAERNIRQIENVLRFIENDYDITTTRIDSVEWPKNHFYQDSLALILSVSQAGFIQFVDIMKNTIEDLHSTGNIKVLKNEALKKSLLLYYNRDKTREIWNMTLINARVDMEKSINKVLTAGQRTGYTKDEIMQLQSGEFQKFVQKLKAVPEFEEHLIGMLYLHHRIILQANRLMELYVTVLLDELRNEIQKHKN